MRINGDEVGELEKFKYLSSVLQKNEGFEQNTKHNIKWKYA